MRTVTRNDDPPDEQEQPCDVCGIWPGDCICPECPTCGVSGDPSCYVPGTHGLIRSDTQTASRAKAEAEWEADNKAYWDEMNLLDEYRYKQELEAGLGMSFDDCPTDAEVNRAQRRLEELFGKDWLEGDEHYQKFLKLQSDQLGAADDWPEDEKE